MLLHLYFLPQHLTSHKNIIWDDKNDPMMWLWQLITCLVRWWFIIEVHIKESWHWAETALRRFRPQSVYCVDVAETTQEHVLYHVIEHWEALCVKSAANVLPLSAAECETDFI